MHPQVIGLLDLIDSMDRGEKRKASEEGPELSGMGSAVKAKAARGAARGEGGGEAATAGRGGLLVRHWRGEASAAPGAAAGGAPAAGPSGGLLSVAEGGLSTELSRQTEAATTSLQQQQQSTQSAAVSSDVSRPRVLHVRGRGRSRHNPRATKLGQ
jgi:hypothetical protein